MSEQTSSKRKKVGIALALSGAVALSGIGGAGLHALFTDTKDLGEASTFATGTVKLGEFTSGVANAEYNEKVQNFAAGDTTFRFFNVVNDGTLDIGRLEARVITSGELSDAGKTGLAQVTQVNGDTSVGEGNTPLHIKFTACVDGDWSAAQDGTNPDGTPKYTPTCSSGNTVEVINENGGTASSDAVKAAMVTVDGIQNLVPMNYFAGDTSVTEITSDDSVAGVGKNVVLYDFREQIADRDQDGAEAIADDTQNNVAAAATLAPGEKISYMITHHLPKTAKNEYQETEAALKLIITGTQRDSRDFEATTAP